MGLKDLLDDQNKTPTSAKAQYDLGSMYENGRGVPQSSEEAYKWYLSHFEYEEFQK